MLGHRQLSVAEYMGIWRRRKKWAIVCFLLGPAVGFGLSLVLPAKYTSSTTVLVEDPKVPTTFITQVVTQTLGARLSTMQEQILSRTRLQPLIERFNLYKSDRNKVAMEELVARMRKNVTVAPIKPLAVTGGAGAPAMPGFTISFTSEQAKLAQQICTEIVSMFMEENLKIRETQAQGTTDFLTKQLEDAKHKLDEQDAKLAEFKRQHIGQLPNDEKGITGNIMMTINAQLDATTSALNRAVQDKAFTESMLAQQVAAWQQSTQTTGPGTASPVALEQQLSLEQAQLVSLEARYTPDHPDVVKLRADIAQLKKKIDEARSAPPPPPAKVLQPSANEPPSIMQLRAQIHQLDQTIREKTHDQERLQKDAQNVRAKLETSPLVEQEYKALTRDYATASAFYDSLLSKENQSEMATDLERRQQGEQFRVMDPPDLPELPSFPNPIFFTLGGMAGGIGLGLGLVVMGEMKDKAIRSDSDVEHFLELPTLAVLPYAVTAVPKNKNGFWRRKKAKTEETESDLVKV
jgi:polysaccharide chain length determinant protein (PEP-CTERM system associated)